MIRTLRIFIEDSVMFIGDFGIREYLSFLKNNFGTDIVTLSEMLERTYEA